MLVYNDGAVVRFREGLVMVGREDVGLVFVLAASEAEIDHQLLCAADAQVRVDECYFLH